MRKYYKNGQCVKKPIILNYNGFQCISPNDLMLLKAGYEIREEKVPELTNEDIKNQRRMAYKHRADEYFIAYQAYVDLNELEKAKEMKALWLEERKKIDEEYPYIEE